MVIWKLVLGWIMYASFTLSLPSGSYRLFEHNSRFESQQYCPCTPVVACSVAASPALSNPRPPQTGSVVLPLHAVPSSKETKTVKGDDMFSFLKKRSSQADLVDYLIHQGIVRSARVAQALRNVDRKEFVPPDFADPSQAYEDHPLPIGHGQTISAPHMHAYALELLAEHLKPGVRALDVGSGSGYLTACMARMVSPGGSVLGIEQVADLAQRSIPWVQAAVPDLWHQGMIRILHGNALTDMLQHEAQFHAIHVGAAADRMPQELVAKLAPGGRMVIPVGPQWTVQHLMLVDKDANGRVSSRPVMDVGYVPLVRPGEMTDGGPERP